jgi:hypothetical protein
VVYRLAQRAHAVLNERSFCCNFQANLTADTLYVFTNQPIVPATAQVNLVNWNPDTYNHWCSVPCTFSGVGTDITFTPDTNLRYLLATTISGQCEASAILIVTDTVPQPQGIRSEKESLFQIYPQPALNYIELKLNSDLGHIPNLKATILNLNGQIVWNEQISSGTATYRLDISGLPPANYLLQLMAGNKSYGSTKLVVRAEK